MWSRKENNIELLEHRVAQLEKEVEASNKKFARKLVETIVFGAAGAILVGFITSLVGGNIFLALLGGG